MRARLALVSTPREPDKDCTTLKTHKNKIGRGRRNVTYKIKLQIVKPTLLMGKECRKLFATGICYNVQCMLSERKKITI